jgi:hypothetical protein
MLASCRTGKLTDRAMKHSSCARSCSSMARSAMAASETVTVGRSTTSTNWPPPSACSAMVPTAWSTYPVTTTPATAAKCKYHSMWHCASDTTSSCSGFQRFGSPRKAVSELPAIAGWPAAMISCVRS